MKCRVASLSLMLAATIAVLAGFAHAQEVPLGSPVGFIASSVNRVADGQYCVSGRSVDETALTNTAWVALVDVSARKTVWKTSLPFKQPYVSNYAMYCVRTDDAYFVLTQEQTHTVASINQTKVTLNKLGRDGKLLMRQPLSVGFDEWAYLLDINGDAITIAGGTSDELDRKGKLATYIARFNGRLERTALAVMPSGAFWTDTNAVIDVNQLRVAGQFLPTKGGMSGGQNAFAVAKIDVDRQRYLFSTYVAPPDERARTSAFGPDGSTYYVATTPTRLFVAVVSPVGKLVQQFATQKIVCDLASIGVRDSKIDMIGTTCDKPRVSTLAEIDLATQRAVLTRRIVGNISAARFDGDTWAAVVDTGDRGIVLRHDAR
ncbi:hypothetical protein OKW33_004701 [Paraburkholderia atlantica]|uniref:hypothetical protein n=2 Tax=Paraburkholderia atlantica TaxID=2654982 RepID=UPI003D20098C